MKKAEEMRNIANAVHEARAKRHEERVKKFINEELAPYLESVAKNGNYEAAKSVPSEMMEDIAKELEGCGYEFKKISPTAYHIWW